MGLAWVEGGVGVATPKRVAIVDAESGADVAFAALEDDAAAAAAWSPHDAREVAVARRNGGVAVWDLRTPAAAARVAADAAGPALCVDYNPNKPFCLAAGGGGPRGSGSGGLECRPRSRRRRGWLRGSSAVAAASRRRVVRGRGGGSSAVAAASRIVRGRGRTKDTDGMLRSAADAQRTRISHPPRRSVPAQAWTAA